MDAVHAMDNASLPDLPYQITKGSVGMRYNNPDDESCS